jgi:hypothetical protein
MTIHVSPPAQSSFKATSDVARDSSRLAARVQRAIPWLAIGTVLAVAVTVFWAFDALPFQDLPAHAGLIALRHRFASSPFEQRFFVFAPHIGPYSLFRFLGELFVRTVGAIPAVRLLGTLPVLATPAALLFARRRLFDDRSVTHGYLGIVLSFGIMTLFGFASYLLGVAVMLVGLTLWLDLLVAADDAPKARSTRNKELMVAALAPAVFLAHGHAFLLLLLCAGISALVTGDRTERLKRARAFLPALVLAAWVAWLERGKSTPEGSVPLEAPLAPHFQGPAEKLGLLMSATLMTRTGIDFVIGLALLAFTIASVVFTVRAIRRSNSEASRDVRHTRALYACAGAISAAFLALPHAVGWFGFVDGRLVPVAIILAILGLRPKALPAAFARGMRIGSPLLASTTSLLALVASYRFQDEASGYRDVLALIPAESRLLNLPLDPNSDVFTGHPFIHYDKLVLVDRPIVASDVWFHQGTALYPTRDNPSLRLPASYSESNLKFIDWPAYRLEDWDYVLIRTRPNAAQPETPARLALCEHRGGWWLFRRVDGSARN